MVHTTLWREYAFLALAVVEDGWNIDLCDRRADTTSGVTSQNIMKSSNAAA
jgi:hypothetical protein